ncbi:helix-turn-helix domain-containing protein [Asticcacaulis machinosus]|uniref:Helix-turn-helix transcriptional regulator n=1 Tax=Asticcacaulis machinosus TaxID=2984211 RepID=A0ABT5HGT6_9CAUL|nr:helix-turn-helix transcriptional regulator [Asticcacaulis machinosus]MDC7675203.1 helix-turn-helix transcriptional regulator [Asticcacaulis machinosus]
MSDDAKSPHPIDVHVGNKVKLRRKFMGISQEELGLAVDVTFQQIQKYEKGSNRISASKLYEISRYLKVPLDYFFDVNMPNDNPVEEIAAEQAVSAFLLTSEGLEIAQSFPKIRKGPTRRKVLDLVRTLTDEN